MYKESMLYNQNRKNGLVYFLNNLHIVFLIFLFKGFIITNAQDITFHDTVYLKYYNEANKQLQASDEEKAFQFLVKAAGLMEKSEDYQILLKTYDQIADIYEMNGAFENAVDYYIKAIEKSGSGDTASINRYYEKIGNAYLNMGDIEKAIEYLKNAGNYFKRGNKLNELFRVTDNIIKAYRIKNEFHKSIELSKEMLEIARKGEDNIKEFYFLNNIGFDHFRLGNYNDAQKYFQDAFNTGIDNNVFPNELVNVLINQAVCMFNVGKPLNAIETLKKASELNKKNIDFYLQARVENLIANIYLNINDLYNAGVFSSNSIISAGKSDNRYILQECYNTYSLILKAGNDHIKALEYYEKYLALRDSLTMEERLAENEKSRNQFNFEKSEKEIKLKIADEEITKMELRESELIRQRQQQRIDSLNKAAKLTELEYKNERQGVALKLEQLAKEQAIDANERLRIDSTNKELTIKIQEQDKERDEDKIKQLEKDKDYQKRMTNYAIIIAVLLVFVAVIILFSLLSSRKKNILLGKQKKEIEDKNYHLEQLNEEITTQKELIEEKNTAITDSIIYGQRIQSAVLPPEEFFKENLHEYFILFKPLNIVSGDFYWGATINNKIIVTAADCTGHGVPGAFMSMLGMAFLNEIVNDMDIVQSDKILNRLRKNVIEALRQKGDTGETNDGMDIALCIIDYKKMIVQFSGAYNPMLFISNETLTEIKPDRMPIGIYVDSERIFSKQEVNFKKGDVFYIFSDGFTDQFGGPNGKKFMNKTFKNLLLKNHLKPMQEQKEILENTFDEWKGNYEQIDDVLVIGVRL